MKQKQGTFNAATSETCCNCIVTQLRFHVPLSTKRSFQTHSLQTISWLGTEETKSNTQ